jgi:hypothetical protein
MLSTEGLVSLSMKEGVAERCPLMRSRQFCWLEIACAPPANARIVATVAAAARRDTPEPLKARRVDSKT